MLAGIHGSQIPRTIYGDMTITGDLTVNGNVSFNEVTDTELDIYQIGDDATRAGGPIDTLAVYADTTFGTATSDHQRQVTIHHSSTGVSALNIPSNTTAVGAVTLPIDAATGGQVISGSVTAGITLTGVLELINYDLDTNVTPNSHATRLFNVNTVSELAGASGAELAHSCMLDGINYAHEVAFAQGVDRSGSYGGAYYGGVLGRAADVGGTYASYLASGNKAGGASTLCALHVLTDNFDIGVNAEGSVATAVVNAAPAAGKTIAGALIAGGAGDITTAINIGGGAGSVGTALNVAKGNITFTRAATSDQIVIVPATDFGSDAVMAWSPNASFVQGLLRKVQWSAATTITGETGIEDADLDTNITNVDYLFGYRVKTLSVLPAFDANMRGLSNGRIEEGADSFRDRFWAGILRPEWTENQNTGARGSVGAATQTTGGWISFETGDQINDVIEYDFGTRYEFNYPDNKVLFQWRLYVPDSTNLEFALGLVGSDRGSGSTSYDADLGGGEDFVVFQYDGTDYKLHAQLNGVSTVLTLTTGLSDTTVYDIRVEVDTDGDLVLYIDGVLQTDAEFDEASGSIDSASLPSVDMMPVMFACTSGAAVSKIELGDAIYSETHD